VSYDDLEKKGYKVFVREEKDMHLCSPQGGKG
jgi:hypothetical protein